MFERRTKMGRALLAMACVIAACSESTRPSDASMLPMDASSSDSGSNDGSSSDGSTSDAGATDSGLACPYVGPPIVDPNLFAPCTPEERRAVLVDNPCAFFGLDPDAELTPTPA